MKLLKTSLWWALSYLPFTRPYQQRSWVKNSYNRHTQRMMEYTFLSIARFAHINRPIEGYYLEFGCHEARTMRLAWKHFRHLFNWDFVAFDSFEGLPEIQEIDKQQIWSKGRLATTEKTFVSVVTQAGMPPERLTTVKGFYDQSLTREVQERLLPRKAAVIYVDCDLYASTVPVLSFIRPFFQRGTVLVFDDWNCFCADPDRGERRAWREFLEANQDLQFEAFVQTDIAKAFICTNPGIPGPAQ